MVVSCTEGYTDKEVEEILIDYSLEYDVPLDVVISLYDMMPTELFDGLPTALEDASACGWFQW